jgi:hypothetical protein
VRRVKESEKLKKRFFDILRMTSIKLFRDKFDFRFRRREIIQQIVRNRMTNKQTNKQKIIMFEVVSPQDTR